MSFVYDYGLEKIAKIDITGADLRIILVMTGSTAATERSANFIGDFSSLEEYDDMSYSRVDLASVSGSLDTTSHFEKVSSDPALWTALDAASLDAIGMIVYLHVTNDADSVPIAYINDAPLFPFNGVGDDVTLTPNSTTGILRISN